MTPEELRAQALQNLATKPEQPVPPLVAAQQQDPWDRGQEAGLDPVNGLDVLREPKNAAMKAAGPGAMQNLINLLVPEDVSGGKMLGMAGGAMGAMSNIVKPATKAKDLATKGMDVWNKEKVAEGIAAKAAEVPLWKQKLGK